MRTHSLQFLSAPTAKKTSRGVQFAAMGARLRLRFLQRRKLVALIFYALPTESDAQNADPAKNQNKSATREKEQKSERNIQRIDRH